MQTRRECFCTCRMNIIIRNSIVLIVLILVLAGCSAHKQKQTEANASSVADGTAEQIGSDEGSEGPEQINIEQEAADEQTVANEPTVSNELTDEEKYQQVIALINEKHYPQAMGILRRLGDYKDSKSLLQQLRYLINGSYICNGAWLAAAITNDGRVLMAYNGDNADDYAGLKDWENVISLSSGGDSIEGLTKEGTILTTSTESKEDLLNSHNVSTAAEANVVEALSVWKNIIAFDTFYPQTAIALAADGSVFAAYPGYQDGTVKLDGWTDIVDVKNGRSYAIGLKSDGTVISKNFDYVGNIDTSNWSDIVAIDGNSSIIGLKEDGTVVFSGVNQWGEGNVSDWKDIIAISTARLYTLGLKSDGTVVAAGSNAFGQMNVQEWKDIVAIAAGEYFSVGLKSDGTMVIAGDCSLSGAKTPDVSEMKNLYVPEIKYQEKLN